MKTKLSILTLAALLIGLPLASSSAYVAVSVGIAPPAIPIYEQPLCPTPGYIWTPGYYAYADYGYYWVPGVWVAPPRIGWYWTPAYWAFRGGRYAFVDGYWGPSIGFYGGINYGFGYYGSGYYGGEWAGSTFRYNTAVSRVNTTVIHNTYVNRTVVKNNFGNRTSFNGPGGINAKPNAREEAAAKAEHVGATSTQRSRRDTAKNDPASRKKAADRTGQADRNKHKNEQGGAKKTDRVGTTNGAHGKTKTADRSQGVKTGQRVQTKKTSHQPNLAGQPSRHPQSVKKAPPRTTGHPPAGAPQNGKKKKKDKENQNR